MMDSDDYTKLIEEAEATLHGVHGLIGRHRDTMKRIIGALYEAQRNLPANRPAPITYNEEIAAIITEAIVHHHAEAKDRYVQGFAYGGDEGYVVRDVSRPPGRQELSRVYDYDKFVKQLVRHKSAAVAEYITHQLFYGSFNCHPLYEPMVRTAEAFAAMRNDLNELFPIQSAEGDLVEGDPRLSKQCEIIVAAAREHCGKLALQLARMQEEIDVVKSRAVPPTVVETGCVDMHGAPIRLGDRVRYNHAGEHVKKEYWNPEYEVVWEAPKFTLRHVGGGKDGGSHDFILRHGGGNGSLEVIEAAGKRPIPSVRGNADPKPQHDTEGVTSEESAATSPHPDTMEPWLVAYRNWQGEFSVRNVVPVSVFYGSNCWHPMPQWFVKVWDLDKKLYRDFALNCVSGPG